MKIIRSFGKFNNNMVSSDYNRSKDHLPPSCLILDLNTMRFTVQPIKVLKGWMLQYPNELKATNLKVVNNNNSIRLIESYTDLDDRLGFIYTRFTGNNILSQTGALEPLLFVIACGRVASNIFKLEDNVEKNFVIQNINQLFDSSRIKLASCLMLNPIFRYGVGFYRLKVTFYGILLDGAATRTISRMEFCLTQEEPRKVDINRAKRVMSGRLSRDLDIQSRAEQAYQKLDSNINDFRKRMIINYDMQSHLNPFENNDLLEVGHAITRYIAILAAEGADWSVQN